VAQGLQERRPLDRQLHVYVRTAPRGSDSPPAPPDLEGLATLAEFRGLGRVSGPPKRETPRGVRGALGAAAEFGFQAMAGVIRRRLRKAAPAKPAPSTIRAQLAGSGTPLGPGPTSGARLYSTM
jgi:hypothetical protein